MREAPSSSTSSFDPASLATGSDPAGHNALPAKGGAVSARPPRGPRTTLRRSTASPRQCMAAFGVAVALLLMASLITKAMNLWPEQPVATWARIPKSSDYYLGYCLGGIDDYMIYRGFMGIPKYLKNADVLFVGNSHMQFGWPRESLQPFFTARHMTYYNLGFGYVETSAFPLAILRKYDLHPKYIVVNVEPFFSKKPSSMAEVVMADTMFGGEKFRIETAGSFYGERYIHRVVPALAEQFPIGDEVYFRSKSDGTIFLAASANLHMMPPPMNVQWQSVIPAAQEFKAVMDRQGIKLILTHSPVVSGDAARELGKVLNVPVVDTGPVPGLFTFDGSHLEHDSAVKFCNAFLEKLTPVLDGSRTGK